MSKLSQLTGDIILRPSPLSICCLEYCSQVLKEKRDYLVEHLMNLVVKPELSPIVIRYMVSRTDTTPLVPTCFVVNYHLRQRTGEWCARRGLSPNVYFSSAIDIVYGSEDLSELPCIFLENLFIPDRLSLAVGKLLEKGSRCKPT